MMSDTDSEEPETKVNSLITEIFSWSLSDVLNKNLYNGRVLEIPKRFSSVYDYTNSFIYPLFAETHADLLSKILGVKRSPTLEIVRVEPVKGSITSNQVYTVYLKRRQRSYVPVVGDLIALTDVRPNCVDDLKRPNMPYLIATVVRMKVKSSLYELQIFSSKPIERDHHGKVTRHFAVYLASLTTNVRISQALHSELGEKRKMFETFLRADSFVRMTEYFYNCVLQTKCCFFEESCEECCLDKATDMLSIGVY